MQILNSIAPHPPRNTNKGREGLSTGTLPWWVRDCDNKVTGKVSAGHEELRNSIAT